MIMEHKDFTEDIILLISGELTDSDAQKLRKHIDNCDICKSEYELQTQLLSDINDDMPQFNVEKLLVDSRRELRQTLYAMDDKKSFVDKIKDFFGLRWTVPALTGSFGIAAGLIVGILFFSQKHSVIDPLFTPVSDNKDAQPRITNVRFDDKDAKDGNITFTFDATKRVTISGSPEDPEIQKLLTYSILNEKNPGTRLNSINLVSNNYTKNELTGIKEALVSAASNDENPGVRLQALKTLASLPFDDEIKKTYLHVLVNDKVPGNRIEAINSLVKAIESGFKADDEILSVFKNQLEQEENPYIKIRAKTILDSKEL
jgi:hypothetical protein